MHPIIFMVSDPAKKVDLAFAVARGDTSKDVEFLAPDTGADNMKSVAKLAGELCEDLERTNEIPRFEHGSVLALGSFQPDTGKLYLEWEADSPDEAYAPDEHEVVF